MLPNLATPSVHNQIPFWKHVTDYSFENMLNDCTGIRLISERKSCLSRQHCDPLLCLQSMCRKRIETVFCQITQIFPKSMSSNEERRDLILRILLFVTAYTLMIVHKDSSLAKTWVSPKDLKKKKYIFLHSIASGPLRRKPLRQAEVAVLFFVFLVALLLMAHAA